MEAGQDRRTTAIHCQTAREDQIEAFRELGIIPSFFSMHTYYWGDWYRKTVLGPERAVTISPARWAVDRGMAYTSHHDAPVALPNSIAILSSQVTRVTRTSGSVLGPDQGQDRLPALSHTPKARPRPTKGNVRSLCPPLLTPPGRSPGWGAEHQQARSTETTCSIHTHRTGSVEVPSRCLPELIWSPQETSPDSTAAETPGLFHPGAVRSCAWGCLGLRLVGARIADPEHGDVSAGATR